MPRKIPDCRHRAGAAGGRRLVLECRDCASCQPGIRAVSTYLRYSTRVSWAELRQYITPYNNHAQQVLAPLHLAMPGGGAGVLGQAVQRQASVQGFVCTFWLIALSFVMLLPLLLLIRSVKGHKPAMLVAE
ncbi:hypothetical protein TPL01_16600 [Sulfuriferula plumbiphila]|uniref:Uncharacterized protein n=1 Tax=Sulfuriferula plumbiphila TaxID=171865 RepID=A0A512L7U0_9PROT|nr:hypothetical protein [Sulfuriferula plumbiphila]BBP03961.1 hypothetical protein SFPGR_13830 [Sulfuriferula plumbiphila]GEP30522.1 hypothetical protein TPL01_16600 [Sulfuriferula plumbiphila]